MIFMNFYSIFSWNGNIESRRRSPQWNMNSYSKIVNVLLYFIIVSPCTKELLIVCKKESPPWPHLPWKLRSLLLPKGNTQYGLEDLSWHHCPLSNKCGSPNKNMMNPVLPLSTGSASKLLLIILFQHHSHPIPFENLKAFLNIIPDFWLLINVSCSGYVNTKKRNNKKSHSVKENSSNHFGPVISGF